MIGIYKITCCKSGKCYIGSSINTINRWRDHLWMLKNKVHHSPGLQNAWNKHGQEMFSFEIIEELETKDKLHVREQYWLDKYDAYKHGYNGRSKVDIHASPDDKTRKLISQKTKEGMARPEVRAKLKACVGSKRGNVKLNEKQVRDIKYKLCDPKTNRRTLAKEYSVSVDAIDDILSEHRWKHVKINKKMYKNTIVKLTRSDAMIIRQLAISGVLTQLEIAEKYNLCQQTVSCIKLGILWPNIK